MNADNPVENILADQKALDDKRSALIRDIIQQRETALAGFDAQLARLGHKADGRKRNHHKTAQKPAAITRKPAA